MTEEETKGGIPCFAMDTKRAERSPLPALFIVHWTHPPSMIHPLDLPEPVDPIASLLSKKAILQSMLVSRHWLGLFTPALWRSVSVGSADALVLSPALTLNSSLVRCLTITNIQECTCSPLLMFPYPKFTHPLLDHDHAFPGSIQAGLSELDFFRQGNVLRSLTLQVNRNITTIRILPFL